MPNSEQHFRLSEKNALSLKKKIEEILVILYLRPFINDVISILKILTIIYDSFMNYGFYNVKHNINSPSLLRWVTLLIDGRSLKVIKKST